MKAIVRTGRGVLAGLLVLAAGCAVGPDYRAPDVQAPARYRDADGRDADGAASPEAARFDWREWFRDERLRGYISQALTNNWDLRIAAARVLQAEAAARVARAEFFPTVGAGAEWQTTRTSERGPAGSVPGRNPVKDYGSVFGTMAAYEVDFWGRIRRANEAARARLLSTRAAEDIVRQTVVTSVATTYLTLLELDFELQIARRTLAARNQSLSLTRAREEGGVASLQDVRQAEILVTSAEAAITDTQRRIEQQENALNVLLGRNPGAVERGNEFLTQRWELEVPVGLPSELLQRRPDLRSAEQELIAANADIGQARAAFYPRVTLTGLYGFQSVALSDLFSSPARTWQFGPSVSVPVFTGGALRGNLAQAKAIHDEAMARYRGTVQEAFREVSDGLVAYRRTREFRVHLEERAAAHRSATDLANVRYEGGVTSYLEVLYNEQELFGAELALAEARLGEMLSVLSVYRALGGGWQGASANP